MFLLTSHQGRCLLSDRPGWALGSFSLLLWAESLRGERKPAEIYFSHFLIFSVFAFLSFCGFSNSMEGKSKRQKKTWRRKHWNIVVTFVCMHACALHLIISGSKEPMTLKRCHKQKLTCQTGHIWGSAWWETPRGCHPRCWPAKATATMSTWFKRRSWLGCQNSFRGKCGSCVICKKKFFSYLFWGQTACGIYLSRMGEGENNRRWKLGRVMAKLWRILHSLLSIFFLHIVTVVITLPSNIKTKSTHPPFVYLGKRKIRLNIFSNP